jgi:hypothetical protein
MIQKRSGEILFLPSHGHIPALKKFVSEAVLRGHSGIVSDKK